MPSTARYVVRIREPNAHRIEVEATFPALGGETLDVALPVWSPGSYLVREYSRHLERMEATANGRRLDVTKVAKNTWRIATGGAPEATVRYVLYAHELTVRTNHVDPSHAFFTGPATWVFVPDRLDLPATVRVEAQPGWLVSTALGPDGGDPTAYFAPDVDTLMDTPFEVGTQEVLEGVAATRPFTYAIWGDASFDRTALVADTARIIESQASIFGGLPYERYLFILHVAVGARGGLEHMDSSVCATSPHAFSTRAGMLDLLSLLSHEHFHVWNVKRIRPGGLVPYRYGEENYTRLLWVAEGATSYYEWQTLIRAGLATRAEYMKHLAERIAQLETTPGRKVQSMEDASFDAWVKLYRPDESTPNVTVSYYLKGKIVWAAIDLELRARSGGRVSADDVMRSLWSSGGGIPEDGLRRLLSDVGGVDVSDLHDRYVTGREEVDVDSHLARAGLRVERGRKSGAPSAGLGARLGTSGGRITVLGVERGGAGESAGLSPGDEILALDGLRVEEGSLKERLGARKPGDEVVLTLFRRERITEIAVRLGDAPLDDYRIVEDPDAPREAVELRDAWLAGAKEAPSGDSNEPNGRPPPARKGT